VSLLESDRGKAALAVYRRRLDCQTMRQLHDVYLILKVRAMRSV
jgi:hypothetical protein